MKKLIMLAVTLTMLMATSCKKENIKHVNVDVKRGTLVQMFKNGAVYSDWNNIIVESGDQLKLDIYSDSSSVDVNYNVDGLIETDHKNITFYTNESGNIIGYTNSNYIVK